MTPSLTLKKKSVKDSASRLGTYTDGCRIRFLTNLSLRVFIFIAFPLSEKSFKVEHAEAARFYVFLRFNHDSGRKNAGMIVAPFASCLSSGKREPVYGCAWRPSFLPACARAADAVVRDGDLGSRNPVHRGHGARHSIDACVPPGSTTNESTSRRPRRVRGARASLEPGRGSEFAAPYVGGKAHAGTTSALFSGRKVLNGAGFADVKTCLNRADCEQALVSQRICKVGLGGSEASLEAVCLRV